MGMRAWGIGLIMGIMGLMPFGGEAMSGMGKLRRVSLARMPGWHKADHRAALAAFRRSCGRMMARARMRPSRFGGERRDWVLPCLAARHVPMTQRAARRFFERYFTPVTVQPGGRPSGIFTGYFEPDVEGSLHKSAEYPWPVLARPADLVRFTKAEEKALGLRYGRRINGRPVPYFTRKEIENGALDGRGLEIVWLKSIVERFFMHIQGSGRVILKEGGALRLTYGGKSGHPFTGIGRKMLERGLITRGQLSMQGIRKWLEAHPKQAREIMWLNKSYVFFRATKLPDPRLGAFGAQGVQLAPLTSLAVDYRFWPYGAPVWLDTRVPGVHGKGFIPFRRLMLAQDTGSAIRGAVRGDIYFGFGREAGARAGRMNAQGRMIVLLPNRLARRLTGQMTRK